MYEAPKELRLHHRGPTRAISDSISMIASSYDTGSQSSQMYFMISRGQDGHHTFNIADTLPWASVIIMIDAAKVLLNLKTAAASSRSGSHIVINLNFKDRCYAITHRKKQAMQLDWQSVSTKVIHASNLLPTIVARSPSPQSAAFVNPWFLNEDARSILCQRTPKA